MTRRDFLAISLGSILISLFIHLGPGEGGMPEGVIVPGERVDNIRIGEVPPKGWPCGTRGEIEVICEGDRAFRIVVRSRNHFLYLVRSRVGIGSDIGDVFSFYGAGEMSEDPEKITIRYPYQGIDFNFNKYNRQITAIEIYRRVAIRR
jgi:hypothetical protein